MICYKVYLGVNNKEVDYLNKALKGQKRYEYGVEWGLAHPKFLIYKVTNIVLSLADNWVVSFS